MPARSLSFAIVLFWIATSAWLFQRDIWPHLRQDMPPPFAIDLADEARQHSSPVRWSILRPNAKGELASIGFMETGIRYQTRDDTFELTSHIPQLHFQVLKIEGKNLNSMYRVTREGVLREIVIDGEFELDLNLLKFEACLHIDGKVDEERFVPHGYVVFGSDPKKRDIDGNRRYFDLEPVPVSSRGNVINPLHPVNRIRGLRPGQHWKTPLVDPLADSINAMIQKDPALSFLKKAANAPMLQAEVLGGAHQLKYGNLFYGCVLIEYRGENLFARTWVRESDGLVLKQEASFSGDHLVLERL